NLVSDECLRLTTGDTILFARSADEALNGGLPAPDYTFNFGLTNSGGTLVIGVGDEVVDQVSWTGSSAGKSTALDPGATDAMHNDLDQNWCPAVTAYGVGDLGTPGEANLPCQAGAMCMD